MEGRVLSGHSPWAEFGALSLEMKEDHRRRDSPCRGKHRGGKQHRKFKSCKKFTMTDVYGQLGDGRRVGAVREPSR